MYNKGKNYLITWDWNSQNPIEKLVKAINDIEGNCFANEVFTYTNQYAILISENKYTDEQAYNLYKEALVEWRYL